MPPCAHGQSSAPRPAPARRILEPPCALQYPPPYVAALRATYGVPRVAALRAEILALPPVARCIDDARPYRHYFPLGAPDRD